MTQRMLKKHVKDIKESLLCKMNKLFVLSCYGLFFQERHVRMFIRSVRSGKEMECANRIMII